MNKKICKICNDHEVYGDGIVTNNRCINCYQEMMDDIRELEHDYYNGDLLI